MCDKADGGCHAPPSQQTTTNHGLLGHFLPWHDFMNNFVNEFVPCVRGESDSPTLQWISATVKSSETTKRRDVRRTQAPRRMLLSQPITIDITTKRQIPACRRPCAKCTLRNASVETCVLSGTMMASRSIDGLLSDPLQHKALVGAL